MTWQTQFSGEIVYRDEQGMVLCGDCLEILPQLPNATMIFADPPDNLGLKYEDFDDIWPCGAQYFDWLKKVIWCGSNSKIFWLSYYHKYQPQIWNIVCSHDSTHWLKDCRQFIWRYTFGQHRETDCANGYRPILRMNDLGFQFQIGAIRVQSQRQRNGDKRANPAGRVPDDVWEFSRVCGTFKERRAWHPNQHPEALIERIVKFSTKEGDLVIDMFAGTGTVHRVCRRLNRKCISIDISKFYCEKIAEETNARPEGSV